MIFFPTLHINATPHVKVDFVIAGQVYQTWSSAHAEIDLLITAAFSASSIINCYVKCSYFHH